MPWSGTGDALAKPLLDQTLEDRQYRRDRSAVVLQEIVQPLRVRGGELPYRPYNINSEDTAAHMSGSRCQWPRRYPASVAP